MTRNEIAAIFLGANIAPWAIVFVSTTNNGNLAVKPFVLAVIVWVGGLIMMLMTRFARGEIEDTRLARKIMRTSLLSSSAVTEVMKSALDKSCSALSELQQILETAASSDLYPRKSHDLDRVLSLLKSARSDLDANEYGGIDSIV